MLRGVQPCVFSCADSRTRVVSAARQDASHLFSTQQPKEIEGTLRSVINVEACGASGPEIVFQATSAEVSTSLEWRGGGWRKSGADALTWASLLQMVRALAKTPRPYGTVLGTEVFSLGIINSDTDFRQFVDYANLTGLDMALVQDSYKSVPLPRSFLCAKP